MKFKIAVILFFLGNTLWAQDPIFTQFFVAPQATNSGFTGFMETTTVGLIHRTQWPDTQLKIHTNYAFINSWVESMNSGVSLSFLNHRESFTDYGLSQINLSYAYRVQLNRDWYFRPALEVGYGMKTYGFGNLVLEDQLNIGSGTTAPVSMDPSSLNEKLSYFDISAGMLFNNEKSYIGLSLKHLNKPNISFTQRGNLPLDMFFSVNAGYELVATEKFGTFMPFDTKLLVTGNFMKQGEYNRFDLGGVLIFTRAVFGITAATNPMWTSENSHLFTSLNMHGGLQYEHFRFGYSYDLNLSGMRRTGGVHEFSLIYQFDLEADCFGCPEYHKRNTWW